VRTKFASVAAFDPRLVEIEPGRRHECRTDCRDRIGQRRRGEELRIDQALERLIEGDIAP